ncbi:protein of unknown function [Taphrina deformans PYCC 5710]|uniref:STAS domain-containing protein n=1 Tax=Taphrina deformans (strain PYCC 5710 / ATCC 11124 / CBS 356.35 / IMI 108563 / JCM 9778 / NBRC 8474) TaxID=1097556 RepID=R4XDL3_TAPDE|nr:protein of unknown function [Taphrina deformans PYCC 5710]|eukprot:CCG83966.1 protein of unknown function [Taphrina deformans PYCC 5710]
MEHVRLLTQEIKDDPTTKWLTGYAVSTTRSLPRTVPRWAVNRVPFIRWIPKYDWRWSLGDFISGLTVGLMLVPQSIAYANVAGLPVQYGLFSSYVAPILYTFIGTSKDLTIGPTAVVSLLAGEIIKQLPNEDAATVAIATAFMVGIMSMALGILKLGIILDFFPGGVLTGYTSGAALTIAVQQVPKLLGEYNVSTRNKTGTVIHDIFASLGSAHWRDILFTLGSIIALVGLQTMGKRYGSKNKILWFISVARNTFVVIIFTAISYGINKHKTKSTSLISIIGHVPAGLYKPAVPDLSLLSNLAGRSITVFLAAVLEHIAIGKAFARKEKYQLDQSQELFSIGVVNIVGSFFGSYAVTGSFSRTAVNNASGSKSPLSGLMCAVVVIVSVVAVTPAFFYISNATLGAVIFLAVIQLVAGPRVWYQLWRLSFWDFLGGQLAFWVTLFYSVEIGIAVSVGYSLVVLLWRVARPSLRLLAEVIDDPLTGDKLDGVYVDSSDKTFQTRSIQPLPGVLIIRLEESLTFPNSRYIKNQIIKQVFAYTNSGSSAHEKRNWNSNQAERVAMIRERAGTSHRSDTLPKLMGLILDFSAVNHLDSTGLQTLFDLRAELQDYSGSKEAFEMHFVCVHKSVLRILELADIAAPIDRPEKNSVYGGPRSRRELPLVRGDTQRCDKRESRGSFSRSRPDIRREHSHHRYEEGDNYARANDPAPFEADGMGPITDPGQRRADGTHGHAAFLDPENDKFFIHLSITQAIAVLSQRLHLQEQKRLEESSSENSATADSSTLNGSEAQSTGSDASGGRDKQVVAPAAGSEEPLSKITGDEGLRLEED